MEVAGNLFSALSEDQLIGGALETEMMALEFYRQVPVIPVLIPALPVLVGKALS